MSILWRQCPMNLVGSSEDFTKKNITKTSIQKMIMQYIPVVGVVLWRVRGTK